jgi:hypothetical protein
MCCTVVHARSLNAYVNVRFFRGAAGADSWMSNGVAKEAKDFHCSSVSM